MGLPPKSQGSFAAGVPVSAALVEDVPVKVLVDLERIAAAYARLAVRVRHMLHALHVAAARAGFGSGLLYGALGVAAHAAHVLYAPP